jgi:hypothetical protein
MLHCSSIFLPLRYPHCYAVNVLHFTKWHTKTEWLPNTPSSRPDLQGPQLKGLSRPAQSTPGQRVPEEGASPGAADGAPSRGSPLQGVFLASQAAWPPAMPEHMSLRACSSNKSVRQFLQPVLSRSMSPWEIQFTFGEVTQV